MAHIIFAGAGHGHLPILKSPQAFHAKGHRLTLIAPEDFYYSGMATGVLARDYPPNDNRVNITSFAAKAGINLIRASVLSLNRDAKTLILSNRDEIAYDLLSLAVGSVAKGLDGGDDLSTPVKPTHPLSALKGALEEMGHAHLAIVGGGLAGVEVALTMKSDLPDLQVSLFARGQIAHSWPGMRKRLLPRLKKAGIALYEGVEVTAVEGKSLRFSSGAPQSFDAVIMANGLKAPALIKECGLKVDEDGAAVVNAYLQSLTDPDIFAIGDCMAFQARPLDKAGVYAIRGAPVLAHNLLARAEGKPLKPFRPQRHYLFIMNLGLSEALAHRPPFTFEGRFAWWLKDVIDRRFMKSLKG